MLKTIVQSLQLDYFTATIPFWSLKTKINFILAKYTHILSLPFKSKFQLGSSAIKTNNREIYFNAPFGLAPYQFVMKTHYPFLKNVKLKDSGIIIDIGANVGYFSLLCRALFPYSKIFACEPITATYLALQKNFINDPNTVTSQIALSSEDRPLKINYHELQNELSKADTAGNEECSALTLDSYLAQNNIDQIDLLKIDTESHEAHVLRGATQSLHKTKYLLIEITVQENENYTFTSLLHQLPPSFQLVQIRTVPSNNNPHYLDCLFHNTRFAY